MAATYCFQDCGRCVAWTFYGDLYNRESGCEQICTERHEYIHRQHCRTGSEGAFRDGECAAYRDTFLCLQSFLDGVGLPRLPV